MSRSIGASVGRAPVPQYSEDRGELERFQRRARTGHYRLGSMGATYAKTVSVDDWQ